MALTDLPGCPHAHLHPVATQRLLRAAEAEAAQNGYEGIYLHVEMSNSAAMSLYESGGYTKKPDTPPYQGFTRALNLEHRDPVLMYRALQA